MRVQAGSATRRCRRWTTLLLVLLVLALFGTAPAGAGGLPIDPGAEGPTGPEGGGEGGGGSSTGSVEITNEGSTVTVRVQGPPGEQVRVETTGDAIVTTGVLDGSGSAVLTFELDPGDRELEVLLFDATGNPRSLGTQTVRIAGPPPPAPTVEVQAASPGNNRTVLVITGPPEGRFRAEIAREGESHGEESGELDGEGKGTASFLLENGPWGYLVTVSNGGASSPAALGEFSLDVGPPTAPVLTRVSEPGQMPVVIGVAGPAGGRAVVTATHEGNEIEEATDLDEAGAGEVELRLEGDGTWRVTAVATDHQGQDSEVGRLEGDLVLRSGGPRLELEPMSVDAGLFGFRIVTDPGTEIRIDSATEALRQSFTAEEEETEIEVEVPPGEHIIEVRAIDELGNETFDTLSSEDEPSSGFPWSTFLLLLLALLAAFGVYAFVKRQELIDWYHTRQYH